MKKEQGITLIALIITIIVMLILVAVAVTSVSKSGLFDHAKDATNRWADEQNKELGISIDDDIKKYVGDDSYFVFGEDGGIGLLSKGTEEVTTFQKAYIEYNGEKIDITSIIEFESWDDDNGEHYEYNYFRGYDVVGFLVNQGIINDEFDSWIEMNYSDQTFILVKNGFEYKGIANIGSLR